MADYDVIVIGTGAGGGTLAHRLAPSGKKILVLERGDWLPRELENWSSEDVFLKGRYVAHENWYGADGREFHPGIHYYVGGNTKMYGAALFRLRERDFEEIRHHDGVSPAWPLKYADFAPYYQQAEELYVVHGSRGEDPTDPPGDAYAYPAVSHEPRIQKLHDDLERAGLHPYHVPVGIRLDEAADGTRMHTSTCIRCATFDGFPCLVRGKADSQVMCVEPAIEHDNVTLMTNAYVSRLETSADGREVTGVVVERDGQEERFTGSIVVSSCGAINSALLLLRSRSDAHPNGLANSSDLVGRNYMRHNNAAFMAVSKEPNLTRFQKTLGFNDFYFDSGDADYEFPLGAVQMLGKSDESMIAAEAPEWAIWKPKMAFHEIARHGVDFWLTTEDLPSRNNRVFYGDDGDVQLHLTESNQESAKRLRRKLHGLLEHLDFHHHLLPRSLYLGRKIPLGGTAHQCGTTVFGTDPAQSVLDLDCRTHDVDNLYVVDGGFFPSSGAVNPALTIIANALRVGDHIRERLA